jgi:hypothetical protein
MSLLVHTSRCRCSGSVRGLHTPLYCSQVSSSFSAVYAFQTAISLPRVARPHLASFCVTRLLLLNDRGRGRPLLGPVHKPQHRSLSNAPQDYLSVRTTVPSAHSRLVAIQPTPVAARRFSGQFIVDLESGQRPSYPISADPSEPPPACSAFASLRAPWHGHFAPWAGVKTLGNWNELTVSPITGEELKHRPTLGSGKTSSDCILLSSKCLRVGDSYAQEHCAFAEGIGR